PVRLRKLIHVFVRSPFLPADLVVVTERAGALWPPARAPALTLARGYLLIVRERSGFGQLGKWAEVPGQLTPLAHWCDQTTTVFAVIDEKVPGSHNPGAGFVDRTHVF